LQIIKRQRPSAYVSSLVAKMKKIYPNIIKELGI